jgi:O-antigen/teichoic acid export membrane protein
MPKKHFSNLIAANFSLKSNIFANFFGNAVMTVASIVFVPVYLRYIGIEAYGLLGFFASFQTILAIMDAGLSLTLTRELAVRDGVEEKAQESRNLVRTLEIIYWGIAVGLGLLSILLIPALTNWVNPNNLSRETIQSCFLIMSFALILQFPITFYLCGLTGLQKQVLSALLTIVFSLFRYVGAWAVLHFVSPEPQSFFLWQAVSSGFQVVVMGICLWQTLPKTLGAARFEKNLLTGIWQFITGMGGIGIVSVLLMQVDKIILVRILPLDTFGYYAIAGLVATALYRIIYPIFLVYYPKFSQLIGKTDETLLPTIYHQGSQVMAVIILPISMMFILFSREIIFLWQQNAETASQTWLLVSLLTIGYALHGLIFIPYALQLAYSWTRLYFYSLTIALIVSIPVMSWSAVSFGAAGAAGVFIIVFGAFLGLMIPLMHRRLLPGEKWKWYRDDFGLPLLGATVTGLAGRFLFIAETSQIFVIIQLGVVFGLIFLTTCLVTPYSRKWILNRLFQKSATAPNLQ